MKPSIASRLLAFLLVVAACASMAGAQATRPATRPARDDAPALTRLLSRCNAVVIVPARPYAVASPIVLQNVHDLTVFAYQASVTADKSQAVGIRVGDTLRLENCQRVTIVGLSIDANRRGRGGYQNDGTGWAWGSATACRSCSPGRCRGTTGGG